MDSSKILVDDKSISHIEIKDPYAYTTGSKVIAHIDFIGQNGTERRVIKRTRDGGYVMQ